jgi:hypothetical protein
MPFLCDRQPSSMADTQAATVHADAGVGLRGS